MGKVIIGIHGLANKPPNGVLSEYWRNSIAEGLSHNCGYDEGFELEVAHWADLLYKYPLHEDRSFDFDALFNEEPYCPAADPYRDLVTYEYSILDRFRTEALRLAGDALDALKKSYGMDRVADAFLARFLKDLAYYYDDERTLSDGGTRRRARDVLQGRFISALRKRAGDDIMVVAHSMGTIIAYDGLRTANQSEDQTDRVPVRHFVTIGSPLGLPHVKDRITEERDYDGRNGRERARNVRTPTLVTRTWVNFADKRDPVALDVNLSDDFHENSSGIRVRDDLVSNTYRDPYRGKPNHHKSYGYLRTPEFSRHVASFLHE